MTLSNTSGLGPPHRDSQMWFDFEDVKCSRLQVVHICSDWLWDLIKKPFHAGDQFAASRGFATNSSSCSGTAPSERSRQKLCKAADGDAVCPRQTSLRAARHRCPGEPFLPCQGSCAALVPRDPKVLGWFRPNTCDSWSFGKNFSKE